MKILYTFFLYISKMQLYRYSFIFTHYHIMPHFYALKIFSYGKHCEKRRNRLKQAISPFLTMLSTLHGIFPQFKYTLKCRLQFVSVWTSLKFCRLVISWLFRFFHLTELRNIYITEIYMRKQYKSSITKKHKIKKKYF